jgi:hypothetical protein
MAKKAKRGRGIAWTKDDDKELRVHSKSKTPVNAIAKAMKRTPGALRQRAHAVGLALGHRR